MINLLTDELKAALLEHDKEKTNYLVLLYIYRGIGLPHKKIYRVETPHFDAYILLLPPPLRLECAEIIVKCTLIPLIFV